SFRASPLQTSWPTCCRPFGAFKQNDSSPTVLIREVPSRRSTVPTPGSTSSRRNPTVLIREVPTIRTQVMAIPHTGKESQSYRTDQGSSDNLHGQGAWDTLIFSHLSRNPTVLIREFPTWASVRVCALG